MEATKKLPDKPSKLIMAALEDFIQIAQNPKYYFSMSDWHQPVRRVNQCAVCFAGAVMANSYATPIDRYASPEYFSHKDYLKFHALNSFRQYGIVQGMNWLEGISWSDEVGARALLYNRLKDMIDAFDGGNIYENAKDIESFIESMIWLAGVFDAEGF